MGLEAAASRGGEPGSGVGLRNVRERLRPRVRAPSCNSSRRPVSPASSVIASRKGSRVNWGSTRASTPCATASSTALRLQRAVGGEIPVASFDALVEAIRSATGMAGHATVLGRGLTWTSAVPGQPAPPRAITITVTSVDGQTTLRGDESMARVASDYLGTGVASALIGSFGAVAAAGGNPSVGVIAAAVAWAGGSLIAAFRMRRRAADRYREQLAEMLDRIAERSAILASTSREPGATPPRGVPPTT